MWALQVLEVLCILTIDILPPVLDTGIQIWNGVIISKKEIKKNKAWNKWEELETPDERSDKLLDGLRIDITNITKIIKQANEAIPALETVSELETIPESETSLRSEPSFKYFVFCP